MMTCPICDAPLERTTLLANEERGPDLRGFRCPQEHGVFVPSDLYFAWRDARHSVPTPEEATPEDATSDSFGDIKKTKLCPQEGRIMRRYRVSAAGAFWLDRCGTCGGVWFDGAEWEALVAMGLHEQLPALFSDAWQRDIEARAYEQYHLDRLREELGADGLGRVEDFRTWAWAHPMRHLILARLNERPGPDA